MIWKKSIYPLAFVAFIAMLVACSSESEPSGVSGNLGDDDPVVEKPDDENLNPESSDSESPISSSEFVASSSSIEQKVSSSSLSFYEAMEIAAGECTKDRLEEIFAFHGDHFRCTETGWGYVSTGGRPAAFLESVGYCYEERKGEVISYESGYYICDGYWWLDAYFTDYDVLEKCADTLYGTLINGLVNQDAVYACSENGWHKATDVDIATKGNACFDSTEGKVILGADSVYYVCDGTYRYHEWRKASKIQYDTYGAECVEGDSIYGKVNTAEVYYCRAASFQGNLVWVPKSRPLGNPCSEMTTWYGDEGIYSLDTGCDDGSETSGYWYVVYDVAEGGSSKIEWPVALSGFDDAIDPIIDQCGGVCGEFMLHKETMKESPYVKIGFNLGGEVVNGSPVVVDASAWKGICIAYIADAPAALEMDLGVIENAAVGYDLPTVALVKSPAGKVASFKWSEFVQNGFGTTISGEDAAKRLVSLKFKIQGNDGLTGEFNIMSIGPYDGKCRLTTY